MSGAAQSLAGAEWLTEPSLQRLLAALSADGEEARVAGGAVRDSLIGRPVADIDVATTTEPPETQRRAEAAGFAVVPTGIGHGTVTVIGGARPFEVTTLRADIETDGRHAVVRFGRDWTADAERRDFTVNALYATADGTIIDLVGGVADLEARRLRFIGDPEQRIREDYLRILRFFRFFAWYGGGRPDAEGLKACARLKEGLDRLSVERVWSELRKLLAAPDPSRAMLWMRQAGVLTRVLPESEKWGIDAVHGLVKAEQELGWPADPLLRLEAVIPPDEPRIEVLADRLKLSAADRQRLRNFARTAAVKPETTDAALAKTLHRADRTGIADRLRLALSGARVRAVNDDAALIEAGGYSRQLDFTGKWKAPEFPLKGGDLVMAGLRAGPEVGKLLRRLQDEWIASDFKLDRDALLALAVREITG